MAVALFDIARKEDQSPGLTPVPLNPLHYRYRLLLSELLTSLDYISTIYTHTNTEDFFLSPPSLVLQHM